MIHPSYFELMDVVNQGTPEGAEPIVTSRYSIVLGTAKRARQIIAAESGATEGTERNPLSVAVDEIMSGRIHILPNAPEEDAAAEVPEENE